MRARGNKAPSNAFTLVPRPKKPGYVQVRFYENAKPFQREEDGLTISGYEYDMYLLEMPVADDLEDRILNNYEAYLAEAKLKEAESKTIPTLEDRVANLEFEKTSLESQLTDTQLALCDVYEAMTAAMEVNN